MARQQQRKKRRSKKAATKHKHAKGTPKKTPSPLPPDTWDVEEFLDETALHEWDCDDSPMSRAREIVHDAFRAPDCRQVELAHEALAICPDCADAYLLLAEHSPSLSEAIEFYEKAMAAGSRALGPEVFRRHAGRFWQVLQTRPYMQARMRLAQCLWKAGRPEAAVEHLQEMLQLDPADHQGVRWVLAGCLLEQDENESLARLLEQYDEDDSTNWAYTSALLAFRQEGDSKEAAKRLAAATRCNGHVPRYLLGDEPLPRRMPDFFSPGEDDEAICYAVDFLSGWKATPGAISWLRKAAGVGLPRREEQPDRALPAAHAALSQLPQAEGELWQADVEAAYCKPLEHVDRVLGELDSLMPECWNLGEKPDTGDCVSDLMEIPQEAGEVWQADVFRMPTWIVADGEPTRPWIVLLIDCTHDLILGHNLLDRQPNPDVLWEQLHAAVQSPMAGPPRRPGEVQIRSEDHRRAVGPQLAEIGVRSVVCDELDPLDSAYNDMISHTVGGPPIPALVDVPGVEPEQVGRFFEAAARFYHKAPWRRVLGDVPIRIECDHFDSGPWYAVVMGQSGMTLGMALYDDVDTLDMLLEGRLTDEEGIRRTSALSVTFDEEFNMAIADLEAAEQFGWPVATPEAYPCTMRVNPGRAIRPPLRWELELLEGCLRAIPEFLDDGQPGRCEIAVPVTSGQLELVISWPEKEAV